MHFSLTRPAQLVGRMALAIALLAPCAAMAEPDMIYLVRHGEKASDGNDPSLTPQGRQRAQNIAAILRRAGIKAIFSSATVRTRDTAQPLSTSLSLPVQQYDAGKPEALVARVKTLQGAVLVVGHSNTLPELVRLFGGAPGPDIGDNEYDRLYQLINGADGKVTTVLLTSLPATP